MVSVEARAVKRKQKVLNVLIKSKMPLSVRGVSDKLGMDWKYTEEVVEELVKERRVRKIKTSQVDVYEPVIGGSKTARKVHLK